MDSLGLATTLISLAIFAAVVYEAIAITRMIGKIPRFWFFFLAAIAFVILRRILILISAALSISLPGYWTTLDNDGTPLIFSALLLIWVYDMRKSFQRSAQPKPELVAPEER